MSSQCPQCGAPVASDSPEGICPKCLMGLGLGNEQQDLPQTTPPTPPGGRFTPPSPAELAPYFPQLEILALVGRGGMGAVYQARQRELDRIVALKILPPAAAEDPSFAERFSREAKTLARMNHPHIVAVYDVGRSGGYYFFVMEFVDGVNLRQALGARSLSQQESLAVVRQICEALEYAHGLGIVHRDIKPDNVLLDKQGRVKIADFGLAKLLSKSAADITLTQANQAMGTPHYMAPEQLFRPLEVDHRADIYSLGVVFYELLTGELPLGRFAPPSRKFQIDVRLDEIVLKALEREPERRYQQASQIKTEIDSMRLAPASIAGEPAPIFDQKLQLSDPNASSAGAVTGSSGRAWRTADRAPREVVPEDAPLSRKAVVGAVLSLPFLFACGVDAIESLTFFGDNLDNLTPVILASPLAAMACLLGGLAVRDIRHGRTWGLPLAAFDALVLPLAILDVALIFFASMVAGTSMDLLVDPPQIPSHILEREHAQDTPPQQRLDATNARQRIEYAHAERVERLTKHLAGMIAVLLCFLLNLLIVWRVWRGLAQSNSQLLEVRDAALSRRDDLST